MSFAQKIHDLRNKAQETQAANKIIDMLKDIESKNDKTTSYRWIWELIQNAKDVANSSGKVDILIAFDEKDKFIEFKHNGKLFSTKNIIFLIEQVSTKERGRVEGNGKKTTGKFGTGFLTTHLLSKKVNVSGYLQDDGDYPYSFTIDIDRSSDEQSTIINSIEESCNQLDKNSVEAKQMINENEFNTCFTYHLDSDGIRSAKKGLNNLIVSAPYVFAFVPEINSITVSGILLDKKFNQTIIRGETTDSTILENVKAMRIDVNTNGNNKQRYIFTITDCTEINVALAVEVDIQNKEKIIKPIHADLPKLFCDFPLLGTNDFSFPVVINSASFNPTEPRNGVFLTDKGLDSEEAIDIKESKDIKENKNIVAKAVELYNTLLEYLSSNNYKGIYHITKISDPPTKEWLSEAWLNENITDKLKSHIQEIELIDTYSGDRKSLRDDRDEPCILIPNHTDVTIRSTLWSLSNKLIPDMITKHEELEYWYNSLWDECRNYSVEDLIEKVERAKNVDNLNKKINGDVIIWLNEFYNLVYSKEYGFAKKLNTEPSIVPNQNGDFSPVSSLHIDSGIEEIYKEICLLLDLDIKSMLVHKGVAATVAKNTYIKKYMFDDMISDIQKALKSQSSSIDNFFQNIICLKSNEYEKQNLFLNLIKDIYFEDSWEIHKVVNFSNEIFELALDFWIEKMCKDVSKCGSIIEFANTYCFEDDSATIDWLGKFVDYLIKQKNESQFESVAILPNQNGDFNKASELNLDSGEIVDIVKDVCEITGYNIRETLLLKDIYFRLPKNRTITIENLAIGITNYIRINKNKLGQTAEEKATFRNFYVYLRENRSMKNIETAFNELCANLNWLYNDDDIAENMRIVEEYNDILYKYGVSSVSELESILSKFNIKEENVEKVEISKELLAQWGITTQEELTYALANNILGPEFVCNSNNSKEMFNYVQAILERSKNRIISYLSSKDGYDLSDIKKVAPTVFVIKKDKEEIYLLARPSDGGEIRLYYETEKDILDYSKDWELWVEDGTNEPEKITFGKMIKLTGINRIPLTRVRGVR